MIETKITGVDALDKVFFALPRAMQTKVYYQSLAVGARVVRDTAEKNVRKEVSSEATGTLAKNIVVNRLRKSRGNFRVAVRIRKGAVNKTKKDKDGNNVRVGLYAAVLEYGSPKLNRSPKSWLRAAQKAEYNNAVNTIAAEVNKRLVSAISEARK